MTDSALQGTLTSHQQRALADVEALLAAFRREFPELQWVATERRSLVHLASCSCGPTPARVVDALARFQEEKRQYGPRWEDWYQRYVFPAHQNFAQLYQVEPGQVVMLANVTAALAAIGACFHEAARAPFEGRYQIVVYRDDFPTIGDVFANYQALGLEVVWVGQETEELAPYLSNKTLLVALSHVSYLTGQRRDLAALVELVHEAGALLAIDDSQSAGTFPVNFDQLGLDLLITDSSKYLLAGEGASGWLIIAQRLLERLEPPGAGWAAHAQFRALCSPVSPGVENSDALWDSTLFEYSPDAWRFATGTTAIKAALEASLAFQLLLETGLERIQRQIAQQVNTLLSACYELQLPLMGSSPRPQGPMVALRAASPTHAKQLEAVLLQHGIVTSARGSALRLACHGFTQDRESGAVWPLLIRHRALLDRRERKGL